MTTNRHAIEPDAHTPDPLEQDSLSKTMPNRLRDGDPGIEIRFAAGDCSLGTLLVAQSPNGLCAILLGDAPEPLLRDLESLFPWAYLIGGDNGLEPLVAQVVDLIETPWRDPGFPLDLHGTYFQCQVWETLRSIPPGETRSYSEVAERISAPRAVRAVARACAANPLAVAIPCHRVVRRDGGLSGYRWGIERKRTLLARERSPAYREPTGHA